MHYVYFWYKGIVTQWIKYLLSDGWIPGLNLFAIKQKCIMCDISVIAY